MLFKLFAFSALFGVALSNEVILDRGALNRNASDADSVPYDYVPYEGEVEFHHGGGGGGGGNVREGGFDRELGCGESFIVQTPNFPKRFPAGTRYVFPNFYLTHVLAILIYFFNSESWSITVAPNVLFRMVCSYFQLPRPNNELEISVTDSSNNVISEVSVDTTYRGEYNKLFRRREALDEEITIDMQVLDLLSLLNTVTSVIAAAPCRNSLILLLIMLNCCC